MQKQLQLKERSSSFTKWFVPYGICRISFAPKPPIPVYVRLHPWVLCSRTLIFMVFEVKAVPKKTNLDTGVKWYSHACKRPSTLSMAFLELYDRLCDNEGIPLLTDFLRCMLQMPSVHVLQICYGEWDKKEQSLFAIELWHVSRCFCHWRTHQSKVNRTSSNLWRQGKGWALN